MRATHEKNTIIHNRESGYSLIQVAIGLIVIGLFVAMSGQAYVLYTKNKQVMTTQERVTEMVAAIQGYRQLYGRYPCPASMLADKDDVNYGHETDCTDTSVAVGDCNGGICIETAIDGAPYTISNGVTITTTDRDAALTNPRVRLGAIPFRLLQLDERRTYDAYGSRFLYAMTESMADPDLFRELNGAIHIVNANGEDLINPPGTAAFVIVSPGPNGLGAYSAQGAQSAECIDTVLDGENCRNFDPLAVITPPTLTNPSFAIFASDYRMDVAAADGFDDVIEYFAESANPLWKRTTANLENIEALVDQSVGVDSVAAAADAFEVPQGVIGYDHDNNVATPVITQRGGIRVQNATDTVQAEAYCDYNGLNCFDPRRLGGTAAEAITCSTPGQYMVGIRGGASLGEGICGDVKTFCNNAATPVLKGFNADGSPNCIAIPLASCNAPVQLCSGGPLMPDRKNSNQAPITNPINLTGSHGQILLATDPASYAPNKRNAYFTCSNGTWLYTGMPTRPNEWGLCSCNVPGSLTRTVNIACAGKLAATNNATVPQTFNTTTCMWENSGPVDYTPCDCSTYVPGAPPASPPPACGAGYNSGSWTRTWTFNYANNICDWQYADVNNCTCLPGSATPPAGAVGAEYTGGAGTACNVPAPGPNMPGHAGLAYPIYKFQNAPVGTCGWVFNRWDKSACSCDTTTEYWHHNTVPSPCNLACETQTAPEEWWYKYIIDVSSNCVPGTPYKKVSATCAAVSFFWRATSGTPVGPSLDNKAGKPGVDEPCTCAEKGTSKTCWKEIPSNPGNYNFFPCTCNL